MKKFLCVWLATLLAMGSVASFSACELGEIDFLNSLLESASEEAGTSDEEETSTGDESTEEDSSSEEQTPDSSESNTPPQEEEEEEQTPPSVVSGVDFTIPAVTKQYGYNMLAFEPNGAKMQSLYKQIYDVCEAFSKSNEDVTPNEGAYRLDTVTLLHYGLSSAEAVAVWATVRNDYPEFWWLKNTISYSSASLFMEIDSEYALASTRQTIDTALKNRALDCAQYISQTDSEAERALDIYEYLSANYSYAYDSSGTPSTETWAHNLVGGALYKKGVCETYAKTYEWFCELFGLECTVVDGYGVTTSGSENHAWNAVRVDGRWFGVDATWSNVTDQNDNVYVTREWFGMGKTEFESSHIVRYAQNYGANYQVPAPTLSENYLCPVYYGIKGQTKTFAPSIDHALVQMTQTNAHYEIQLYPESDVLKTSARKLYPGGATFISKATPNVAKIDFIGRYVFINATQFWESKLIIPATLTLQCNLTLIDLQAENEEAIVTNGYQYVKKFTK